MMKTPRRRAREFALQGLYQAQLNPDLSAVTISRNLQDNEAFSKADQELFGQIFHGAINQKADYLALITPLLDRAEAEVNPIERAILLLACHELSAMPQTPYPVIINEAIELTKTFGGTDSYKFINGILDKLALQLRPNDPPRT